MRPHSAFLRNIKGLIFATPAVLILFLAAGAALSCFLRQEITFDFLNYHYYNGFAFLNNRLGFDIAPANVHTYFNPLLDSALYLLYRHLPIAWYSAVMGIPFGALMFAVFKTGGLYFDLSAAKGRIIVLLCLVISATGYATWFQIGISSHEITLAVFTVTAFYLLAKNLAAGNKKIFFLAGFLLGTAAGFKLTAVIYCLSTGATLILFWKSIDRPFVKISLFIAGGAAGFLLINGFWMAELWTRFGNPVFPYMNAFFKSPYFDQSNYLYEQPMDYPLWLKVFLPVMFLNHSPDANTQTVAVASFTDIRFFLGMMIGLLYLPFIKKKPLDKKTAFLAVWLIASYISWFSFGRQIRFAVPIEVLLSIIFLKAVTSFKYPHGIIREALSWSALIIIFAALMMTPLKSERWGTAKRLEMPELNIPANTLLYTLDAPTSFFAAKLAEQGDVRIISRMTFQSTTHPWAFVQRSRFAQEIKEIARAHTGPEMALVITDGRPVQMDKMSCFSVFTIGKQWMYLCLPSDRFKEIFPPENLSRYAN